MLEDAALLFESAYHYILLRPQPEVVTPIDMRDSTGGPDTMLREMRSHGPV